MRPRPTADDSVAYRMLPGIPDAWDIKVGSVPFDGARPSSWELFDDDQQLAGWVFTTTAVGDSDCDGFEPTVWVGPVEGRVGPAFRGPECAAKWIVDQRSALTGSTRCEALERRWRMFHSMT